LAKETKKRTTIKITNFEVGDILVTLIENAVVF